jgi:hypothetical protein
MRGFFRTRRKRLRLPRGIRYRTLMADPQKYRHDAARLRADAAEAHDEDLRCQILEIG